jgi:hypothetical protein
MVHYYYIPQPSPVISNDCAARRAHVCFHHSDSSSTLDGLFKIVQSENQHQQQLMDETGSHYWHDLNVGTIHTTTIMNLVQ